MGSAAGHPLVQQGGLARAGATRHDVEGAQAELHIQVLEVVALEPLQAQGAPFWPGCGGWLGRCARQPNLRRRGIGVQGQGQQLCGRPAPQQVPTGGSGAGAQVDEPIRGADHAGFVFHHHHGLALVAQALEHADERAHFAGMQPRRGLVQHQEEAAQFAQGQAEQAQALGLAARKAGRGAIQAQVAQAQLQHQIAAGQEFVSDGRQHGGFGGSDDISCFSGQQKRAQFPDAEGRQVHDALPAPGHGQGLGPQARAPAGGAGAALYEAQDGVVALAPEDLLYDWHQAPVETVLARAGRDARPLEARLQWVLAVGHLQALGAVEHHMANLVRQLLPRDLHGATVGVKHLVQHRQGHLRIHEVAIGCAHAQGAFPQALRGIGHQQVQVQAVFDAKALAVRAGAFRAVEREEAATGLYAFGARAQPCEEQAQQVPAFRERAHRGTGIGLAAALAQGHSGAQALDAAGRGAPEAAHKVPGEGRQGLQEAALALAEQGVEG